MNQIGAELGEAVWRLIGPRARSLPGAAALNGGRRASSVSYPPATDQDVTPLHKSDNLGVCQCLSARVCVYISADSIPLERSTSSREIFKLAGQPQRQFRCWCCLGATPGSLLLPAMNLFTRTFILLTALSNSIGSFKLNDNSIRSNSPCSTIGPLNVQRRYDWVSSLTNVSRCCWSHSPLNLIWLACYVLGAIACNFTKGDVKMDWNAFSDSFWFIWLKLQSQTVDITKTIKTVHFDPILKGSSFAF